MASGKFDRRHVIRAEDSGYCPDVVLRYRHLHSLKREIGNLVVQICGAAVDGAGGFRVELEVDQLFAAFLKCCLSGNAVVEQP